MPDDLKAFYARQMEVYAGYSENADYNVGRVIDAIDELGELDNTLILWIWGDNGASMEGTITGSFNELTMQNGIPLTDEMQLQLSERYGGIDEWGAAIMDPHYGAAWAWAGQHAVPVGQAGRLAPRRDPQPAGRALARPHRRRAAGCARSSPTSSTSPRPSSTSPASRCPDTVDGIDQEPMHGTTFAASLTDAAAPEHRTQQYFETIGNRAMYKDGWWLAMKTDAHPLGAHPRGARAVRAGRRGTRTPDPAELYYLPDDFTQAHDLAADHPDKVEELKELFWQEAERYKVLPLLGALSTFFGMLPPIPDETTFEFRGDVQNVMPGMIPRIYNRSYSITRRPGRARRRGRGRHRRRGRPPRRLHASTSRTASSPTPTR